MMSELKKTAVVGGGAAGFFLAINLKEHCPEMHVSILERSQKVLAKVEVSGGGRCNCTIRQTEHLKQFEGPLDGIVLFVHDGEVLVHVPKVAGHESLQL